MLVFIYYVYIYRMMMVMMMLPMMMMIMMIVIIYYIPNPSGREKTQNIVARYSGLVSGKACFNLFFCYKGIIGR